MSALRLLVVGTDAVFAAAVRDVLAAQLPDAACETFDPGSLKTRPIADGLVIDGRGDAMSAAELAARFRAMAFTGALVVVSSEKPDQALSAAGAAHTAPGGIGSQLVPALADQFTQGQSEHAPEVMRARRLVAAGEIAVRFQHSVNNPLAGILAEAQLMQLDPMPPEQSAAVERIVGLCRRIIELGRSLDGLGEKK
jgi:signal transduction histidine kinase